MVTSGMPERRVDRSVVRVKPVTTSVASDLRKYSASERTCAHLDRRVQALARIADPDRIEQEATAARRIDARGDKVMADALALEDAFVLPPVRRHPNLRVLALQRPEDRDHPRGLRQKGAVGHEANHRLILVPKSIM